ncbi:rCG50536 [Rattus norvegicus]|uniref:RCG50536 n=1 Tax=Rattus norvegicus TaxID=10116 RepID=A6KCH3_RAT|nr:rCG50536 [Rattus norvegicus]
MEAIKVNGNVRVRFNTEIKYFALFVFSVSMYPKSVWIIEVGTLSSLKPGLCLILFVQDRVSLCGPSCPGTL